MNIIRIVGVLLFIFTIGILGISLSTYIWPTTEGKVIKSEKKFTYLKGQHKPKLTKKPSADFVSVFSVEIKYEYKINETTYTNNMISLFNKKIIPKYGVYIPKEGHLLYIKYFPLYKHLSVIEAGSPIFFIGFILFISVILIRINFILLWFHTVLLKN